MTDDLKNKGRQDDIRINVSQDWEVRYWVRKLKTTEVKLKQAVKVVGNLATDVREYLSTIKPGQAGSSLGSWTEGPKRSPSASSSAPGE
jgi:hypothetical protein